MIAVAAGFGFGAFVALLWALRELMLIHDCLDFLCNEITGKDADAG